MVERIKITGGNRLIGEVPIEGSKNAVLPILAASILAEDGIVSLDNVPNLSDVGTMNKVLRGLGADVKFDKNNNIIEIDASGELSHEASFDFVSKMRASVVVMGPLLARYGKAKVAMPGGCAIGSRPVDIHLKGFKQLGAQINVEQGYIEADADKLVGADIYLDFPSVGATQNLIMAATLAEGTTNLYNVAEEPEIVDLCNILNKMGARISGAGTEHIVIKGVDKLHGASHSVIQDRIEAGTFMIAAAATRGKVLIEDAIVEHNRPLISKMQEMGVSVEELPEGILINAMDRDLKPISVTTTPHPGYPTDLQAPMTVLQLTGDGISEMEETVFENRFMHLDELRRMNAEFEIKGQTVFLKGPTKLKGAQVSATDLRAAAALIIAGLISDDETTVDHLEYLDRGYSNISEKLAGLGANIRREAI